jgi:glyoxylase-like metal-dependent hydrolase (beta-lactamase superfamily II)
LWPYLERAIEKECRISPGDFSFVLYTHSHPDHLDAGSLLEERYKLRQAMSLEEKTFLEGPGLSIFRWMGLDPPTGTISRILKDGPLELEDKLLQVYLTPGHTPGGICLHWPEKRILITGDLIFARSFGRVDLEGGDARAILDSIKRMAALDQVDTIIPGHGPTIQGRDRVNQNYEFIFQMFREVGLE